MDSRFATQIQRVSASGQPSRSVRLLADRQVAQLRPLLEAIVRRRDEVVPEWYQLYARRFGERRSLSKAEFVHLFGVALHRIFNPLIEGNWKQFAHESIRLGERLIERRMPSAEAFACLGLFQESAQFVFPLNPPLFAIHTALEHLNLELACLITAAYFSSHAAVAGERIAIEDRVESRLASGRTRFHGLVGSNPSMRELYHDIEAVGRNCGTVLIRGENGTGKSVIARAVHECSGRAGERFAALNCKALPPDLIESELFGAGRGPDSEYLGILRAAHGGTVFLNEITSIGLRTQGRLLQAIRRGTVRPVESAREHPLDVRIIAATSRDPAEAIASHRLNPRLLDYLRASVLEIAPLRDRRDDLPLLVEHFIAFFNRRFDRAVAGVSVDAIRAMTRYPWPGNVRELAATVEESCIFSESPTIGVEHLPPLIGESAFGRRAARVHP
jgi:transcriptional regulator with AAA-type ATPase domain